MFCDQQQALKKAFKSNGSNFCFYKWLIDFDSYFKHLLSKLNLYLNLFNIREAEFHCNSLLYHLSCQQLNFHNCMLCQARTKITDFQRKRNCLRKLMQTSRFWFFDRWKIIQIKKYALDTQHSNFNMQHFDAWCYDGT